MDNIQSKSRIANHCHMYNGTGDVATCGGRIPHRQFRMGIYAMGDSAASVCGDGIGCCRGIARRMARRITTASAFVCQPSCAFGTQNSPLASSRPSTSNDCTSAAKGKSNQQIHNWSAPSNFVAIAYGLTAFF